MGQRLTGGTAIGVGWRIVAKVLLAPAPDGLCPRGQRLGTDRDDAGLLARQYFLTRKIGKRGLQATLSQPG
jgi:hypothetical protein